MPFYPGYPQGDPVPSLAQSLAGAEPTATPAAALDPRAAGRFRYSGGGFALVQQLIEDVAGTPFAEVARTMVFDPLGMARSTFLQPPPEPLRDAAARPDWRFYPECAAAGLWTTPNDLARFVCALQDGVLGEGTAKAMTTPHVPVPCRGQWRLLGLLGLQPPVSHGLGLFLNGHRFINLGGAAGFFSALTGSTQDGTGAVVMTAGCRPPFVLRVLFELSDARGWSGLRASRRGIRLRMSDLLLRAVS